MFWLAIILFAIVTLVIYLIGNIKPRNNFPPGPRGYPIVGNFFQLGQERHKECMKLSQKYGDILGLQLGPNRVVILNNYRHIKEALNQNLLSGRPITGFIKDRNRGDLRGILFNEGPSWLEQRKFALRSLREFGFGKQSMEILIMQEVDELIVNLVKKTGQALSTQSECNAAVINTLWSMICGKRYAHDDQLLNDLMNRINSLFAKPGLITALALFFPQVHTLQTYLPSIFPNPVVPFADKLYTFLEEIVSQHKATFESGSPRDFIDVYLQQMQNTQDPHSSFFGAEGEKTLPVVMLDLFIAGFETTSTTLSWAFLLLALNSQVQEKLASQIEQVVGNSRRVTLADQSSLPYLEATIMEITRFSSFAPFALNHKAMEDVVFHGYLIPKNTVLMPNLYAAHHNPDVWDDPECFKPERFLSQDETLVIPHEALMAFSTGRRLCPGITLAKVELYIFLGNLIQRFKVDLVQKVEPPLDWESFGNLYPKQHQVILTDRFK